MSFWSQRRDDSPQTPQTTPAATPAARSQPARQQAAPARSAPSAPSSTVIAAGSTFVGEVTGNTELVVRGVVKGQIDLDSRVIIGAEGRVEGDIRAESIEIAGKVHGNVRCESLLKVHSSGSLEGEVVTVDLDVDSGCFLSGRVQRVKPGEVSKTPTSSSVAASNAAAKSESSGTDKSESVKAESKAPEAPSGESKTEAESKGTSGEASEQPSSGGDQRGSGGGRNRQRQRQGKGVPAGRR